MADDSSEDPGLIRYYSLLTIDNYCLIASSTLLWFDYVSTLTTEYRRIWQRKFTGATIIYIGVRYVAVIERIFDVLEELVWILDDKACGGIAHADDILTILNSLALSTFTCLRIYAIWGRDWKALIFVLPLALFKPILGIYKTTDYTSFEADDSGGCLSIYNFQDSVWTLSKIIPIAIEAVAIVLTGIKTYGIVRDARKTGIRTPLASLLLRDGTIYFLITFIAQLPLLVPTRLQVSTVWSLWQYFGPVFTTIAVSRLILNLRGVYFADNAGSEGGTSLHLSATRFCGLNTANIVGNLGATLMPSTEPEDAPIDAHRYVDHSRAHSESIFPEWESSSELEAVGTYDAWDMEDETPEYCDDPFTMDSFLSSAHTSTLAIAFKSNAITASSELSQSRSQHNRYDLRVEPVLRIQLPKYPSAIILIGHSQFFAFVHIIPETGDMETMCRRCNNPRDDKFRVSRTDEVSREPLGTVTLPKEERDAIIALWNEVVDRAKKLSEETVVHPRRDDGKPQDVALLVQQILKPAALGAMKALDTKAQSHGTTETATIPLYTVQVNHSKPDWITSREPKTIRSCA
ncbi:hypothetical protein C8Q70DRAFT_937757 [Cubamyces menziesii]|nr:hypothetical protein C8Q70DRAFT_937757 [Cubamyces menziesii]